MTSSQPVDTKARVKYITWKNDDWVKFLMEFNRQYPDKNPLDEKFRLREQEFRSVQDVALPERKRPVYPSVLERATKTLKNMSVELGSIYALTPSAAVGQDTPSVESASATPAAAAQLKADKTASVATNLSNGKIRWKQDEWISIAIALHVAHPEKEILNQPSLDFLTPSDVFAAQTGLEPQRRRLLDSISGAMEINRGKLLSVFPVARARTRGFSPRQPMEHVVAVPAVEVQSAPRPAVVSAPPQPSLHVQPQKPVVETKIATAPATVAPPPVAKPVLPESVAQQRSEQAKPIPGTHIASAPKAETTAHKVEAQAPKAETSSPYLPVAALHKVSQTDMTAMAEVMRPFVAMLFQEMTRAIMGALPEGFISGFRDGLVNDVVSRINQRINTGEKGRSNGTERRQPMPSPVAPSQHAVTALAGRKLPDAPDSYGARDEQPVTARADHPSFDPLDHEPNGNVAEPVHEKLIDDIDRQILQNPLAYLGRNDKIATVAVVGIKWRDQNDLKSAFPQIDFTCIQGDKDVQVSSLTRCSKVIGVNGHLKPTVDKMLAQVIPTRYSTVDGIDGVKRKLTKMINDGDFVNSRL